MIPPAAAPSAKPAKLSKPKARPSWTPEKSAELYGVESWGHGFFGVNDDGHVTVKLADKDGDAHVSLHNVIEGLRDRGTHLPVLLRFRDLLHSRIIQRDRQNAGLTGGKICVTWLHAQGEMVGGMGG